MPQYSSPREIVNNSKQAFGAPLLAFLIADLLPKPRRAGWLAYDALGQLLIALQFALDLGLVVQDGVQQ